MRELILIRGLPGSGKSALANSFEGEHYEADSYFMIYRDPETGELINRYQRDGVYEFDAAKLKEAHESCCNRVKTAMSLGYDRIVVSNTFTQEWEMQPYFDMAEYYGYRVHSIIVENRHGGVNEHGVGEEYIKKMKDRFDIKL